MIKLDLIERTNNLCEAIGGLILDHTTVAVGATILVSAVSCDINNSFHTERPVERIELPIPPLPKSEQEELLSLIESIFSSYGLPEGIGSTMAYYESRLNPKAVSKTGCLGLFQFCKGTARAYGLENREDPIASTIAAAELMLDNAHRLEKEGIELTNVNLYLSHMLGSTGTTLLHRKLEGRNLNRKDRRTLRRVLKPNWYKAMGHLNHRVSTTNVVRFYAHVTNLFNNIYKEVNHNV
jgi:hypothetical protein